DRELVDLARAELVLGRGEERRLRAGTQHRRHPGARQPEREDLAELRVAAPEQADGVTAQRQRLTQHGQAARQRRGAAHAHGRASFPRRTKSSYASRTASSIEPGWYPSSVRALAMSARRCMRRMRTAPGVKRGSTSGARRITKKLTASARPLMTGPGRRRRGRRRPVTPSKIVISS